MSAAPKDTARVFFALWPTPEARDALASLARTVQSECGGRPTRADKIHLTLFFVGQVDRHRLADLERIGSGVDGSAFVLVLERLGYFRHNRIAWAGGGCPASLATLVAQLREALAAYAAGSEDRPYVPHITLLREARRRPVATSLPPIAWQAQDFTLVESVTAAPSRYDIIRRWPLK